MDDEDRDYCRACLEESLHYDENTLLKVYAALARAGLSPARALAAVNEMQNEGLLFRERKGS